MPSLCACGCGHLAPIATRTRGSIKKGESLRFISGHALHTESARRNQRMASMARTGIKNPKLSGANHPRWQNKPSYGALHNWLRSHKNRTGVCQLCNNSSTTHFANISGEYKRDVGDYIELCVPCHRAFDKET